MDLALLGERKRYSVVPESNTGPNSVGETTVAARHSHHQEVCSSQGRPAANFGSSQHDYLAAVGR